MKDKLLSLVGFSSQRDDLRTEIISGITTFFTMVYILALMPAMFAPLRAQGFPAESMFTATALSAIVGTLLMAFVAKRPFGLAPGLTLNVFFIETVCISLGYPWQFALTAVLIEGILFILICIKCKRLINIPQLSFGLIFLFADSVGDARFPLSSFSNSSSEFCIEVFLDSFYCNFVIFIWNVRI